MQRQGYIQGGNTRLHYRQYGNGEKVLLAFHGYGNDASLFHSFERYVGSTYTIYSFDMPHHGNSGYGDTEYWTKRDAAALITEILKQTNAKKVSLAGYSMGARVCLCMAEEKPEMIDKMVLLAPDGLVFNLLYFFVTRTRTGSFLFKRLLSQNDRYERYVDWMRRRRVLNEARYKFLMNYLDGHESRKFLLKVWPAMRYLIPDMRKLKRNFQSHPIPIHLFVGKYDKVIPEKNAHIFSRRKNNVQVHVLNKGHRVFDSETLPQIAKALLENK